ncbi:hypothetical protein [Streptomyces carminius]|uniref:hypothetical protein n=1 Tax=Streptomyces carminius TaxID=2665496 RepID=UPI0018ECC090|nr:hypothetical protein [Streptomyces carminius]
MVFKSNGPAIRTPRGPGRSSSARHHSTSTAGALPLVTFQRSCRFPPGIPPDGEVVTSVSALRFHERDGIEVPLNAAGFEVDEVRGRAGPAGP